MDPEDLPKRTTPYYSLYQREAFVRGSQKEQFPIFNTDPDELEKEAKNRLSEGGWNYASSNAGLSWTDRANREAFYRWRIVPRMLRPTLQRDITTELLGHKINAPIIFAPIGICEIYDSRGELPVAKVAQELNLPYCLSTAGSRPIEEVGEANGNGPRFYQLYMPHDDELTLSLITRAHKSGFTACILTVDTWQLGWRHNDIATANYAFYKGKGCDLGWSDPVFQKHLKKAGVDPEKDPKRAGELWIDQIWHGKAHTWEKIPWIIKEWKKLTNGKPFLLKGIQCAEDAKMALEVGCDGIVVSNHAGRQVDGAVGSLDQLPEIVDAVGKKMTIIFDSGIRSGADIFKALALGAHSVSVGRLWVYGLSIRGEAGVRHVMKSLLADFDILMNVAGYTSVKELIGNRKALRHVSDVAGSPAPKL